jgi:hypothetical protein
MARRSIQLACSVLLAALGCGQADSGISHAFRVRDAQFFEGELPGTPASGMPASAGHGAADAGASAADGGVSAGPPRITSVETANLNVSQGQGGKAFRGRASKNAASLAIALADSEPKPGYWVLPMGAPDPSTDELTWNAVTDFDASISTGKHALVLVAIDSQGRAGEQLALDLCVTGRVPDNGSACYPDKQPPHAVISLQWDVNADLDLEVVEPGGRVVDSQHPSDAPAADGGTADGSSSTAVIDRDSNAGCVIDGLRTENMVWNAGAPPAGTYGIYVNLFDACKQPAVRFRIAVYTDDGGDLTEQLVKDGELIDISANPRAEHGLFVTEYTFN